jgi:SAM-dependent methyltransferase
MSKNVNKMKKCICCDKENLTQILDLNEQPLANSYHDNKEELDKYPLGLNLCKNCFHLQLTHCVNPDLLFKDYLYVSGTSQTLKDNMDWFSKFVLVDYYKDRVQNVLDIACNDGTQLDYFKDFTTVWGDSPKTYGIDPAKNLYEDCKKKGHNVQCCYFGEHNTDDFPETGFDVIIAQNVFAHNKDALQFLNDCSDLMHDNSLLFIQTSQSNMILENQFDTIYHEHLSFFNINSMRTLGLRSNGLFLCDVIKTPIHGISYLFVFTKNFNRIDNSEFTMKNLLEVEKVKGLHNEKTYDTYKKNVLKITNDFKDRIKKAREYDFKIVGYGAAAKGMTFLNFTDVKLDYIIDDNPLKQNLYTPGTNIEIKSVDFLKTYSDEDKILFVPLAWNFFDEIKTRILKVRDNKNDRFLKYFPSLKLEKK